MKVYANTKLVASGAKSFDDKDGTEVRYFENILKDTEGAIATVNSKADYSAVEGQMGIATLRIKNDGKLSLMSFAADESFELPESDIQ